MLVSPSKILCAYCLLLAPFLATLPSNAQALGAPAARCDQAAHKAASAQDVPLEYLLAITRTETGRTIAGSVAPWPWAVNVGGQGFWFDGEAEATRFVKARLASDIENVDVGCFQLNVRWHGDNFPSIEQMFDPEQNALYAAGYLRRMYLETGDWLSAVAAYHSRTPEFGARYLEKFQRILADLPADTARSPPGSFSTARRSQLPGTGGVVSLGSLVPLGGSSTASPFIQFIN